MEADSLLKIFALLALIFVSAFFSGSESAFFTLGLYRVRRLKDRAYESFVAAQKLLSAPTKLIATILTGNEIVNAAIGIVGTSLVYDLFAHRVDPRVLPFYSIALVLPFVLIFGEILPKTYAIKHAEKWVEKAAKVVFLFSKTVRPIRDFLYWMPELLFKIFRVPPKPEEDISEELFRSLVDVGREEGVLDEHERTLIHNVFALDDIKISQIMTPKRKVSFLRLNMSMAEVLKHAEEERFSRFPVLDLQGQTVVGVLYAKDLLGLEPNDQISQLKDFLRSPLFVSPNTKALELFARFRAGRTHFAVVMDEEAKNIVGVVTLENVLEEIFGEIQDEEDLDSEDL